jgi:F-type H+-transporting ATPase subunit b
VYLFEVVAAGAVSAIQPAAETASGGEVSGLSINLFWVIVGALNFLVFLAVIWRMAFDPISDMLAQRKARIDQGLADAEQARKDRDSAAAERDRVIGDARKEAMLIVTAAQKAAADVREADIAATRDELARIRERASAEIAAERDRALAELRAEVANLALAAASKVVGESMTDARQRRLVDDFLSQAEPGASDPGTPGEGRPN